eukprot:3871575-Prymnesium_polylepis.1
MRSDRGDVGRHISDRRLAPLAAGARPIAIVFCFIRKPKPIAMIASHVLMVSVACVARSVGPGRHGGGAGTDFALARHCQSHCQCGGVAKRPMARP